MLKVVIGLPGCGKDRLLRAMEAEGHRVFDDFSANTAAPFVEMSPNYGPLMDELMAGHDCAVSDIAFCEPEYRSDFFKAVTTRLRGQPIEWIYFENAPEKCRKNIEGQSGERVELDLRALEDLSRRYVVPAGTVVRPVDVEQCESC